MLASPSYPATASYSSGFSRDSSLVLECPVPLRGTYHTTGQPENSRLVLAGPPPEALDTYTRLLLTRFERLLPGIWQDWEAKQAHLNEVDAASALLSLRRLLLTVPLTASALSAGFTYEQSLYVRAELPESAGGTLYVEVNLGPEADAAEDAFASIRQNRQEKWATSGPFRTVLTALRHILPA